MYIVILLCALYDAIGHRYKYFPYTQAIFADGIVRTFYKLYILGGDRWQTPLVQVMFLRPNEFLKTAYLRVFYVILVLVADATGAVG